MAWDKLPTNYTDAVWEGLRRYRQINNADGTISLEDKTVYANKDNSFFGAKDANRMNTALNIIMSMLENGTDLYAAFTEYFEQQREAFEQRSDEEGIRQMEVFNLWFDTIKGQLSQDQAGHLQNQIGNLDTKVNGFTSKTTKFTADASRVEETSGTTRTVTEFISDKEIKQYFYADGVTLTHIKTITFSDGGLTVKEEVR